MTLSQHRPGVAPRAPAATGLGHGTLGALGPVRTFVTCLRRRLGTDAKTLLTSFADPRNGCWTVKSGGQWRRNIGRVMKTSVGYGREGADEKALVTLCRSTNGRRPCVVRRVLWPTGFRSRPVDPARRPAPPANATSTNSASSSSRLTIFRASAGIKSSPSSPKSASPSSGSSPSTARELCGFFARLQGVGLGAVPMGHEHTTFTDLRRPMC